MGGGFYLISQLTEIQRNNILEFLKLINNIPGYLFLAMIVIVLFYGLFVYPIGKFFGKTMIAAWEDFKGHNLKSETYHDEVRQEIQVLTGSLTELSVQMAALPHIMEQMKLLAQDMHTLAEKFRR
jgi:hypothetical protein